MIPRKTNRPRRLSATFVRTVNVPGRYGNGYGGHGLSLIVKPASRRGLSKSWARVIRPNGSTTSVGLGRYPLVTLAMARERALANARALAEGPRSPPPRAAVDDLRASLRDGNRDPRRELEGPRQDRAPVAGEPARLRHGAPRGRPPAWWSRSAATRP